MAELTLEQQRALALARARVRVQQQAKARPAPAPKKPEETGFLRDVADVGISLGRGVIDLAKPFAYAAQRAFPTSILPVISGTVLGETEEALKGARSEADILREQARQRTIAEEAKAPGAVARGLSSARQFIEGPKRPEAARSALSDIADYLSPGRVIGGLLPGTPEEAQREVSTVTSQFGSPIEAAQFFASQLPSTAATVAAGGLNRATALAQGLGRTAAAQAGERAAVRTGIALNSTDAGYSAAQDVLAKGGTQEEADRAFVVAAGGAAIASNVASKLPGLEQNLFSTKALKPGIIRGAARSAVGEAPQEFIEESGAQLAQNIGKLGTAAETDISEGLLSSGALGAIGGATIGAGAGAAQSFAARGTEQPAAAPQPTIEGEPLRTTRITFPNRADPSAPITRTIDVMSEPDADGYITVRDDTGKAFEMRAADLAEREAASAAFEIPSEEEAAPAPTIDRATITERLRLASGTPEGAKPAGRVVSLANDVASALEAEDPVAAQRAIQSRMNALATSRMAEETKAQRQAEIDEAQSIVNDYRVEFARARAAAPARVEAPAVEPSSIEQAIEQNAALAAEDEVRAAEERAQLERESALESASLIGQGSPIRQAQTERQQLFNTIINDATVENPAAAFRQALAERNYPNTELNEAERRQVQARLAFEQAPIVEEEPVAGEPTEVPAPPSAAPPEVVAGAAEPVVEEEGIPPAPTTAPTVVTAPPSAPAAAPTAPPAGAPVKLTPYENVAMSIVYYPSGAEYSYIGAKEPEWGPPARDRDRSLERYSPGYDYDTARAFVGKRDIDAVEVKNGILPNGEKVTTVSVIVPSVDETLGDRGNHTGVTFWFRGAYPADLASTIETAQTVAKWIANPSNSKKSNGPLNSIGNQALEYVADLGGREPSESTDYNPNLLSSPNTVVAPDIAAAAADIQNRLDAGETHIQVVLEEEPGVAAVPLGEPTEEVKSSEAVSPPSIIGGDEVDIDAFRGQSLFDLLGYISSNEDGRYSPEDVFLAERLNGLLGQLQQAGFDIDLSILQAGDAAPSSIARGRARGLAEIDLKNGKVVVYLRSPQLGNGANSTEIILHESLHAVATGVLLAVKNGRGTPAMMKFRKELNELRNQVIRHFNDRVKSNAELTPFEQSMYNRTTNAFANLDEFLTWGMTNKLAQDYLRSIPIGPTKSLFDKFIDAFRSLLGISPNDTSALSHLIEIVNPIFETTAEEYKTTLRQAPEDFQGQETASQAIYAGPSIIEPRKEDTEAAAKERRIIAGNYRFAEEMEDQGASPELIRVATGWERNPYDNEWRYLQADDMAFESPLLEDMISDFDAAKEYNAMAFNPDGSIELQDLIGHPDLFQIYPEARNIRVFIRKAAPGNTTQGSFDPRDKSIEVYTSATDPLGTLLHEIQHWVQDKEGFATGASPESVWNKLSNEQKLSEADRAVDYLNSQIEDNNRIVEFIDWALADPDFKRMAKDGLTREDLEELAGSYFIEVPGTDDLMILDLLEILDMQDELAQQAGINPGPINAARLKGVRSQTVSNTKGKRTQIDAIQSGDVTDDSSAAAKAARDVFQTGSRRSTIRYEDTAGEIEARDVTAQRRKSPEELRKAGALASERKRTPSEVVVSRRGQAPSLSVETQPQASVDPEPVRISRLRQAATRWRTSAAWSNIGSQFSGIRAADNWRARSYGVTSLPESDSFYSGFETYLAKKNGQLMKLRRDYVDPIDDAVSDAIKNGVTLDDINDALQARGAAERNAEIAAKNKDMPDGGSGLTDAQAEAILSDLQLSGKMRYINRVLKLHDRLRNKTQEMMVKDGLVSAETMADWKRKYPNYTPYKGWAPSGDLTVEGQPDPHADYGAYEGGRPVYSRVAGLRAKPVKEAKGRSSQAANSLYNMIADAEMFLEMGQRNQVINTVATEYQRDPSAFEGLLTIYDEKHPKIVKGKPVKITDENAYKNGIRAFKEGKPYIIETAPNEEGRATLRAFNNLDPLQLGKWTERFLKLMSVMRGLHTRFNPAFWPREFLRSVSDAAGNVFTEKGRKRSAAYGKSAAMKTWKYSWSPNTMAGVFSHLVNREPGSEEIAFVKALTEEMIVNGGAAGQEFAERAERVAKRMEAELKRLTATGVKSGYYETKEGFSKLLKAVDGINDFVDLVPRVAAYRALTEAGLTPEQAAPIALRSTLDLTKMGRFGRIIDGIFWWTTPSLTNLTRKVTSLDSSTYRKMLIAQLGIGFALGMLNVMNAPDSDGDGEDDYSQMPEWRKLAFLHVYYSPDEKPLTLPIGFLFVFERYVGGKMAEVLAGKTSDAKASVDILTAGQQVGAAFLSSLSPVIRSTEARTLAPTSVAPMYDLLINESFFKSPIYNEPFDESVAKASRTKPSTPEIYKKIAQGLQEMTGGYGRVKGDIDVSPDQLKYFVDQYTGGVGRLVGGAVEGDIEAVNKLNPFYFDPKLVEYAPMGRFYENQPDMKRAIDAQKLADEGDDSEKVFMENTKPVAIDSTVVEAYKTADKELKELRKDANEMDPDEYRSKQLEIMSTFNEKYNDVKRREQ